MRKFIACLLLGALLGMIPRLLPAQQNQSTQRSNTEIEALKKRISELEKQLQTVENAEKLDLQAQLAEANAKLITADFDKFKGELGTASEERLRNWSHWLFGIFLGVLGFIALTSGAAIVFWLKSLIADRVEKSLHGFKEAVGELNLIKNQLTGLEKQYGASILENFTRIRLDEEHRHPQPIKALREETLLQIFDDERYHLVLRYKAAEVLGARKSPRLVPPLLKFLNSVVDSDVVDSDIEIDFDIENYLRNSLIVFSHIHTHKTYRGLKEFLNRLLTENPRHKDLLLTPTVFSLAWVSIKLNLGDSIPILKMAIPHVEFGQQNHNALINLARHFDIFNDPAGIKEILIHHVTSGRSGMEDVENKCLEFLQKHDPKYVASRRASKTADNSEV